MCVKSGELSDSGRPGGGVGDLLHDLEEKMEVARVQLMIVEALEALRAGRGGVPNLRATKANIESALALLNAELLDISQLYQEYAEPFELWECQLAILHCSGHQDPMLVETMWDNIIEAELKLSEGLPSNSRIAMISNKIKSLGKIYAGSLKYFPLGKYFQ